MIPTCQEIGTAALTCDWVFYNLGLGISHNFIFLIVLLLAHIVLWIDQPMKYKIWHISRSSLWYWQLCWERFPPNRWLLRRYKSPIFPLLHRSPLYDIKTSWNRDLFLHEKLVFASGKTLTFPKGKKTAFRYFSVEVSCGGHTAIGCAGCPYPLSQVFLIFLKKQKA